MAPMPRVLQLHLEHRLVKRLLSRFLSLGFQSGLSRACVIATESAKPRIVLLGRLALYGPGAARLHEEIIPITAPWIEADRGTGRLRPFGRTGEGTTLDVLKKALQDPWSRPPNVLERVRSFAASDAAALEPELRRRADEQQAMVATELTERGRVEADALLKLLRDQRDRIGKAEAVPDDAQLTLFRDDEAEQRRRDRAHWRRKLTSLDAQIDTEPVRVRERYAVRASRVELVGLVYLWPRSN